MTSLHLSSGHGEVETSNCGAVLNECHRERVVDENLQNVPVFESHQQPLPAAGTADHLEEKKEKTKKT